MFRRMQIWWPTHAHPLAGIFRSQPGLDSASLFPRSEGSASTDRFSQKRIDRKTADRWQQSVAPQNPRIRPFHVQTERSVSGRFVVNRRRSASWRWAPVVNSIWMIELIDYAQVSGYSSRIDATSEFAFLLYLNVKSINVKILCKFDWIWISSLMCKELEFKDYTLSKLNH